MEHFEIQTVSPTLAQHSDFEPDSEDDSSNEMLPLLPDI